MPAEVERNIRSAADRAGVPVSQWIAAVAERAATVEDGLVAVGEWEAEHGPISPAADARARDVLARAGLLTTDDLPQTA